MLTLCRCVLKAKVLFWALQGTWTWSFQILRVEDGLNAFYTSDGHESLRTGGVERYSLNMKCPLPVCVLKACQLVVIVCEMVEMLWFGTSLEECNQGMFLGYTLSLFLPSLSSPPHFWLPWSKNLSSHTFCHDSLPNSIQKCETRWCGLNSETISQIVFPLFKLFLEGISTLPKV